MKAHAFIPIALAGLLLLAGCEQKTEPAAQTTPSPSSTPSPSPSATPTPTPESTPSAPAPTPLKSPAEITTPPAQSPSAATGDARPTFSSQSANEYVQSYDAYI